MQLREYVLSKVMWLKFVKSRQMIRDGYTATVKVAVCKEAFVRKLIKYEKKLP